MKRILIVTKSKLTACLAAICGATFGLRVESAPSSSGREPADGVILDMNSLDEEDGQDETRRLASLGCPKAVLGEGLDAACRRALNRRGVSTHRRLDEGVLRELAWRIANRRTRRAA
jgi:hypothetical protein